MCGFAGLFQAAGGTADELVATARRMVATLVHRGPDDEGVWADPAAGVSFGFRRLSIIDRSQNGHQPMRSASGRFTIVFNGEVYNFGELRAELGAGGFRCRGHSDTEVILGAFERWGVRGAVPRFVGMFAIAVWDRDDRSLTLIRDRLGIKPLFVYHEPGLVTFGSELKALLAGPRFDRTLDPEGLASYLRYLYVPAPATVFRRCVKLAPGHVLRIVDPGRALPAAEPYWSAEEAAARGVANPFAGTDDEAVDELERLLTEAVRLRLIADVPLGALLSGGVDSSTVIALMQRLTDRPVKTYTIGFAEPEWDEGPHAARVARHLGTEHTELRLTDADALAVVPRLPDIFDEPHGDPSQVPTFLVSQLARSGVTVALTGDGGDELFGGYNRYAHGERAIRQAARWPHAVRRLAGAWLRLVARGDRNGGAATALAALGLQQRLVGGKLEKLGLSMGFDSPAQMYRSLVSVWQHPEAWVDGATGAGDPVLRVLHGAGRDRLLERMMLADQIGYLPDDLLAKVDRASMAVSLEARVPVLDHRVVEFSWRLARNLKVRGGRGKWILRAVLERHVPRDITDRPKMGFSVPLEQWLGGALLPWAESALSLERLRRIDGLRVEPIRREWAGFRAGRRRTALGLWGVLMLSAWHERWIG
jgi:asparagine synthase (glutamine-hydrolysing)